MIRDRSDIMGLFALAFFICLVLLIFLMDAYLIVFKGTDSIGSPVIGGLFSVVPVVLAVTMYRSTAKRRRRAMEFRREAMEMGRRYDGWIVNAGKERETETYDTTDENGDREVRYVNVPNYWIEVEYVVSETGEAKRFKAIHFVRHMKRFIGCQVDVYVWYVWSDILNNKLSQTYIDTSRLN